MYVIGLNTSSCDVRIFLHFRIRMRRERQLYFLYTWISAFDLRLVERLVYFLTISHSYLFCTHAEARLILYYCKTTTFCQHNFVVFCHRYFTTIYFVLLQLTHINLQSIEQRYISDLKFSDRLKMTENAKIGWTQQLPCCTVPHLYFIFTDAQE